jgi:hypothetical protein
MCEIAGSLKLSATACNPQVGDPRDGWSQVFSFYTRSQHPDADVRVFAFADQVRETSLPR